VCQVIAPGTTLYAYEASSWDGLHAHYDARRINHSIAFHDEGVDTNQAESFFSRMRRAEIGQHHHMGIHLHQYAGEMAWREDNRRKPNGRQFMNVAGAALGHPAAGRVLAAVVSCSRRVAGVADRLWHLEGCGGADGDCRAEAGPARGLHKKQAGALGA
jgi:hypothetical protein